MKMKLVRTIDSLGRLVIPISLREKIGVKNNDEVNIELQDDRIIITSAKNDDKIKRINDKLVEMKDKYKMATDKEFYFGYIQALEWLLEEE